MSKARAGCTPSPRGPRDRIAILHSEFSRASGLRSFDYLYRPLGIGPWADATRKLFRTVLVDRTRVLTRECAHGLAPILEWRRGHAHAGCVRVGRSRSEKAWLAVRR